MYINVACPFLIKNDQLIKGKSAGGFYEFVEESDPDIICLQEIKANEDQVELSLDKYPYRIWNSAEKKGYSGTAIFSKIKPVSFSLGIDVE